MALTLRLTGSNQRTQPKIDSCLVNITRRMQATYSNTLMDYLAKIDASPTELAHFISAVTIHTTSWFREMPHFERLRHLAAMAATASQQGKRTVPLRVLSAGCSTGEEGYSLALVLEEQRQKQPRFDYTVEGWDVDPVSVGVANQAVYNMAQHAGIPASFQRLLLVGSGKTQGYFTLDKEIRRRCQFRRRSLLSPLSKDDAVFDAIFCRNVLIYFDQASIRTIIDNLVARLAADGHLCLGHSESIEAASYGLKAFGNTTYKRTLEDPTAPTTVRAVGVQAKPAAAPASAFHRQVLQRPDLILVGASTGGTEALIKLLHAMPRPCPPVVVVQHIALSFAKAFAERLAQSSGLTLGTPVSGCILQDKHLYMALDDYHLGLRRRGHQYVLEIGRDGPRHGVRPSIDCLFESLAKSLSIGNVAAVILTGMGKDGAKGLKELHQRGAMTFAQDEASSTVFGMPREAIQLGAAGYIGTPESIRQQLCQALAMGRTNAS